MNAQRRTLEDSTGRRCTIAAITLFAILAISPRQSNAGDVDWTIAPYVWAADAGLDVRINGDPGIGADVPFSDLVDKLDGAFMGHIEVGADKYGAFLDTVYIKLADDSVIPVGPGGPILGDLLINTDLTLKLYELGGFYRMGRPDTGSAAIDILLGLRLVEMDQNLNIVLPGPGATPIRNNLHVSETDLIAGARVVGKISEKWGYKLRADYGSGGTEGTLNALATVGYTFGKTNLFSIDIGYRYTKIDVKGESSGSVTESDLTLSGPAIGFIFTF